MDTQKAIELQARAEDLKDLLSHIAWTDTIKPEFDKVRDSYERFLTASVLGQKVVIPTPAGPAPVSSEQIAARIDGINFVEGLLAKVLAEGVRAFKELQKYEISSPSSARD